MPIQQPAHFFDRLPAKEAAAAGIHQAYLFRRTSDGRYFLGDTPAVDGAERVYFKDRGDYAGQVSLDEEPVDARAAVLYGTDIVLL